MSPFVIRGAQTTGGSLGSMLAPAKVIAGCSIAGLADQKGEVPKPTLVYGLVITCAVGLDGWVVTCVVGLT